MAKWTGTPPRQCDICHHRFTEGEAFYDARLLIRPYSWANLCVLCFERFGAGLGTGIGQKYDYTTREKLDG